MLLSICVPTYNRGHRALNLAQELISIQKKYPNDIEIVISNNGSTEYADEYAKISELSSDNFIYHRFNSNQDYVRNYNKVIKLSNGNFCLIISDEDSICCENFEYYLNYLSNNPQVGIVRAKTDSHYELSNINDHYAIGGIDAINAYFLEGNYISGIIYNRNYLTNEFIDNIYSLYNRNDQNRGYFYYPHLFVESCLLIQYDFYRCNKLLINENIAESDMPTISSANIPLYSTFQERLLQFCGYLELISHTAPTDRLCLQMVMIAINKTIQLINLQKENYINLGYNWNVLINGIVEIMLENVNNINMPSINDNFSIISNYTRNLINTF